MSAAPMIFIAASAAARCEAYRDKSGCWRSEGRWLFRAATLAFTREEVAARIGMTHQAVTRLIAGQSRPSLKRAVRIESVFPKIPPRAWCAAPNATGSCEPSGASDVNSKPTRRGGSNAAEDDEDDERR